MNDIYFSGLAVCREEKKKKVACSYKTLIVLDNCRSRSRVEVEVDRMELFFFFVVGGTSRFSLFFFFSLLTDCPSALVGATEPSLPWHLDQCQATKLKCHFKLSSSACHCRTGFVPRLRLQVSYHVVSGRLFSPPSHIQISLTYRPRVSTLRLRWVRVRGRSTRDAKDKERRQRRYKDFTSPALSCLIVSPWDC